MRTILIFSLLFIVSAIGCQKEEETSSTFWETIDPEQTGISADSITFALNNAKNLNNFYALIVIKDGKIVAEEYFNGKNGNSHFQLRSITKSVISILAGIAIDEGFLSGVDQPLSEIFSEIGNDEHGNITIGHLLTMSSGIEWDEESDVIDILEHKGGDPFDIFLEQEIITEIGSTFNYSTLSTHILGMAIAESSKMTLEKFTKKYLFDPLGIDSYQWERDSKGRVWGSTGLQLRSRDMARLGLLVLNEGVWQNNQIVSSSWIREMTLGHIEINESGSLYGYQWWIADHLQPQLVFAQGFGGQALMLIPEKNTFIVANQEHYVGFENSSHQWSLFLSKVFWPIYHAVE